MRSAWACLAVTCLAPACSQGPKQTDIDGVWVRLAAVRQNPAAAYFTIHGGAEPRALINVTADVAIKSEMHDMRGASMAPLKSVAIPANADVAFRPGERHVMLYHVNPGIQPGRTIMLTFTFGDGGRLQRKAAVIGAGDPAPHD